MYFGVISAIAFSVLARPVVDDTITSRTNRLACLDSHLLDLRGHLGQLLLVVLIGLRLIVPVCASHTSTSRTRDQAYKLGRFLAASSTSTENK
jgi:hypothetical protein